MSKIRDNHSLCVVNFSNVAQAFSPETVPIRDFVSDRVERWSRECDAMIVH